MEEQGAVSVWIGSAESLSDWERATETSVSAEGDFQGSQFSRGFGVGRYEIDFQEAQYYSRGRKRVSLLLRGVSYDDQVIPAVERLDHRVTETDNCFVLLYNYRYVGDTKEWQGSGVKLRFVGTVSYDSAGGTR